MNNSCRLAGLFLLIPVSSPAAFLLGDIDFWTGSGDARAALVIDWNDGTTDRSYAWGYRWNPEESRTGSDLLSAVVAADPRLSVSGILSGFVSDFRFDPDGSGSLVEHFRPGYDPVTEEFWGYYVNNGVEESDFTASSHLLPPNGEPYADIRPGTWNASNTGINDRPLADGSYDGFIYTTFGGATPASPVAAAPVPEPGTMLLLGLAAPLLFRRRCA